MANVSPHSPPTATTISSFFLSQFRGHCLFRAAPVSAVTIIVVAVVVTVVVPPMQAAVNQVVDHDETNHPAEANKRNHPRVQRVHQGMSFFVVHLSAHQCVAILGPLRERVANVSLRLSPFSAIVYSPSWRSPSAHSGRLATFNEESNQIKPNRICACRDLRVGGQDKKRQTSSDLLLVELILVPVTRLVI